jgi:hypothetical protein
MYHQGSAENNESDASFLTRVSKDHERAEPSKLHEGGVEGLDSARHSIENIVA